MFCSQRQLRFHSFRYTPHPPQYIQLCLDLLPRRLLFQQELVLLVLTPPDIHTQYQAEGADHAEGHEEVEYGGGAVPRTLGVVDDCARDERAKEGGRLANDAKEGEEEKLLSAGSDFRYLPPILSAGCYTRKDQGKGGTNHSLGVSKPRTYHEPEIRLENPKLPAAVEPDCPAPDSHKAVCCHEYNRHTGHVKHGLRADLVLVLDEPVDVHAHSLSAEREKEEVGQDKAVEGLDFILEGGDDGISRVEGVSKEEVDCAFSENL